METWDLYTAERKLSGKTMTRGDERPEGLFSLCATVWIKSPDGKYLISRRSPDKQTYPLFWETCGGGVISGETSLEGAVREVWEEVGIKVKPEKLKLMFSEIGTRWEQGYINEIVDYYLYEMEEYYDEKLAVSDEVIESRWLTRDEIRKMLDEGIMVPMLEYFFDKIDI